MNKAKKIWLYWNTVKNLKWIQIRHQIKKRVAKGFRKRLLKRIRQLSAPEAANTEKVKLLIPELDCGEAYLRRFQVKELLNNRIELLHEAYTIDNIWRIPEASHLWNYNLHYLEFMIPLAVEYGKTSEKKYFLKWKELTESWLGQASEDSLEPYTISMRIPNMLICMELLQKELKDTDLEKRLLDSLYQQYRYLICTQELALLANHYFENLKAIVIASLLFQEADVYHKYFRLFLRQIHEQILADGFHFERSFMYHKIILEDILRVHKALNSSGQGEDAQKLIPAIKKMTSVMIKLEKGFGSRTPLFNDAGNNVAKGSRELSEAAEKASGPDNAENKKTCGPDNAENKKACGPDNAENKKVCGPDNSENIKLKTAGYYRLSGNGLELLFDCGDIGPSYMGGHGHCDCLSFELSLNGKMIFVNSGTGQYQGKLRSFFRSTAAHNTLMIDDREQSELWGEHRAGRRITNIHGIEKENELRGSFTSYHKDSFRRILRWKAGNRLLIIDGFKVHDSGTHVAREFFHLAPEYEYIPVNQMVCQQDSLAGMPFCRHGRSGHRILIKSKGRTAASIRIPEGSSCQIHQEGALTVYAEDFGRYEKKQVLEICTPFEDRIQIYLEIEILYL